MRLFFSVGEKATKSIERISNQPGTVPVRLPTAVLWVGGGGVLEPCEIVCGQSDEMRQ